MKKFTMRIATMGAAVMMAVSMMSAHVSAKTESASWILRRVTTYGAPSSESIYNAVTVFAPNYGKSITKFVDNCKEYYSANTSKGTQAYVIYNICSEDYTGLNSNILDKHKHVGTGENKYYINPSIFYGKVLRVRYKLINTNNLHCFMSGLATATISNKAY